MPTNVYFDHGNTNEQRLYEDLIIEQLQIYGQDVYYLPRTIVNEDQILGEDTASKFTSAYAIEMYVENQDGFEGEQEIIRKFGVELRDDVSLVVSKTRWEKVLEAENNLIESSRPNEGDLIWFPVVNAFFEIQFVEHEQPFYQVQNVPVYKLKCTKWEYSLRKKFLLVFMISTKPKKICQLICWHIKLVLKVEQIRLVQL